MDQDGCHKSIAHFPYLCCSSILNPQVLLYDGRDIHFDYREFNILGRHHIQYLILKAYDSVNNQPTNNSPNTNLNNFHCNGRINWTRNHGTLKFTPPHTNSVLFEIRGELKLSLATTTQKYFKNIHLLTLYPPDKGTNHQV